VGAPRYVLNLQLLLSLLHDACERLVSGAIFPFRHEELHNKRDRSQAIDHIIVKLVFDRKTRNVDGRDVFQNHRPGL
jgi:hypothetical protein